MKKVITSVVTRCAHKLTPTEKIHFYLMLLMLVIAIFTMLSK